MELLKKFFLTGFKPGDYEWGVVHISSIVLTILLVIVLSIILKNRDKKIINTVVKVIAILTLVVYFTRHFIGLESTIRNGNASFESIFKSFYPFYLCNVSTFLLCIFIIFNIKKGLEFLIIIGPIGAIITFLMPYGIFVDKYLTISILDSILSHSAIIVIPLVLLFTKTYQLNIRKSWHVILGLAFVLINGEGLQRLFIEFKWFNSFTDYLYMHDASIFGFSGLLLKLQPLIISILVVTAVFLFYGLYYLVLKIKHRHKNSVIKANQH